MKKHSFLGLTLAWSLCVGCSARDHAPLPAPSTASGAAGAAAVTKTSGGRAQRSATGFAGVGWSVAPRTDDATREALAYAEAGNEGKTAITFAYYTPQHDPAEIIARLRGVDRGRRIIGMSSHDGILTADGYHSSPAGVVGILALQAQGMIVGLGGVSFDELGPGKQFEAARSAYRLAVADARPPAGAKPSMVLVFPTLQSEEQVLAAISEEVGPDVPVIGGTAAGPSKDIDLGRLKEGVDWSLVVDNRVIHSGVAIAVFYTSSSFGWAYGGGFERSTAKSGVVTSAEPRMLRTIDGRPALDVYDEWVGGGLKEAMARGENMLVWCALHPLTRSVSGAGIVQTQFVHPHPNPDQKGAPGTMLVGANVTVGETLNLGEGSWNILLNRFAQLPRQAMTATAGIEPLAGMFFYCGGALETIPRDNRANMGYLVSKSMGNELPWIGVFSWGEQGHVTGVGNLHGNEMASSLLFPAMAH